MLFSSMFENGLPKGKKYKQGMQFSMKNCDQASIYILVLYS